MSDERCPGRLLITGASGFLGWHLCNRARTKWSVYGVWRDHPIAVDDVIGIRADLADPAHLDTVMDTIRPEAVIHTAAQSSPDKCETDPEGSWRINVVASQQLARRCGRDRIPLVFISTDLVFDGLHAPYGEGDPVNPLSTYGRQKVEAEHRIPQHHPTALVCRLPLMIGRSGGHGRTFSLAIRDAIADRRPIDLFVDEYRTPIDGDSAARAILRFLGRRSGCLHLGGRTRISRFQMGRRLARAMGHDDACIRPTSIASLPTTARRPPDVSLDSLQATAQGFDPADLDTILEDIGRDVSGARR